MIREKWNERALPLNDDKEVQSLMYGPYKGIFILTDLETLPLEAKLLSEMRYNHDDFIHDDDEKKINLLYNMQYHNLLSEILTKNVVYGYIEPSILLDSTPILVYIDEINMESIKQNSIRNYARVNGKTIIRDENELEIAVKELLSSTNPGHTMKAAIYDPYTGYKFTNKDNKEIIVYKKKNETKEDAIIRVRKAHNMED